jgi:predicted AAA+ superfamily ATPase
MIKRALQQAIESRMFKGKAILLFGARQTGKSTLSEMILSGNPSESLVLNGDEEEVRQLLNQTTVARLKMIIGKKIVLLIDEAQRLENIGLTLKLITDQIKEVQVIATGSSAFNLSGKVNEPLTGRKFEFTLFPLSFQEMKDHHGWLEEKRQLEQRLLYGYYPEIVTHPEEAPERLKLLAGSYLYKDILMLEEIKKPTLLDKLLRALALQIGNEVSYTELGQLTGSNYKTIEKYIDLLEKAYVIFQLPAFSRNVRNEIRKGKKVYFYDCGIRNAILNDFKPLALRNDTGALWENFLIAERMKLLHYSQKDFKHFFWRTTQQQEIDLIEEQGYELHAYEFKWNPLSRVKFSKTFTEKYPNTPTAVITPDNMESFIMDTEML